VLPLKLTANFSEILCIDRIRLNGLTTRRWNWWEAFARPVGGSQLQSTLFAIGTDSTLARSSTKAGSKENRVESMLLIVTGGIPRVKRPTPIFSGRFCRKTVFQNLPLRLNSSLTTLAGFRRSKQSPIKHSSNLHNMLTRAFCIRKTDGA